MPHHHGLAMSREVTVYFRGGTHNGKPLAVCEGQKVVPDGEWETMPKKGDVWRVKISGFLSGVWFAVPIHCELEGATHEARPRPLRRGKQSQGRDGQAGRAARLGQAPAATEKPKRRERVTFRRGHGDSIITYIDGKISFPCDRGGWPIAKPKAGEIWLVEVLGLTSSERAYRLGPVELIPA